MDDLDFSVFEDTDIGIGDFGDFSGFDTAEVYSAYEEPFSPGTTFGAEDGDFASINPGEYGGVPGENIFDTVFKSGTGLLNKVISRPDARPANTKSGTSGGIMEAIYLYGKGKTELALESAIKKSSAGQKAIKNIEGERIRAYLPWIIGGALLLLVLGGIGARYARK